jgi:hypothetical protein
MNKLPDSSLTWRTPKPWLWCGILVSAAVVLVLAAGLEPDARGHGTHTQLGLPPCGFWLLTGSPCPGCGLTTAFAHAIRGQWALAAGANAFGLLLFVLVCAAIPISLLGALRGWSVDEVLQRLAIGRWALAVAGCGVVMWLVRLAAAI